MDESPAEIMTRLGFARKRARIVVEVDLDPVPGWGNTADDYRALIQRQLSDTIPHYNPVVSCDS